VLFRPKDIVSGDFYWFSQLENGEFLLVVADCTGHGIAGAFMSIIGTSLLNEVVYGKQVVKPSDILDELDKKINIYLGNHQNFSERDNLMDVGICKINKTNKVLEFAGANIPLYRFGKNQLEAIKPDRYGIGGLKPEDAQPYNTYLLTFEEDDFIYLFTDGYIDQFGGENDEKVKASKFSKLLASVQQHNAQEQQKILDHWLNEWKFNKEQTDDILVVGIRL
jgi:serine phosphatase RsbU (regulator of sigma subunit)